MSTANAQTKSASSLPSEPLKIFILPNNISKEARFVSLSHPRDGTRRRFLFCPQRGLFDLTRISTPSIDPRSILFTPAEVLDEAVSEKKDDALPVPLEVYRGYINREAYYFVVTSFDLIFLLVSILNNAAIGSGKTLFQPLDDLLDDALEKDHNLQYIIQNGRIQVERALSRICDSIEAGGEKMYRLNLDKVLQVLLKKAERCATTGLPASMEERLVSRTLEAPVLSIRREESSVSMTADEPNSQDTDSIVESLDSQSSLASTTVSAVFSEAASVSSISTVDAQTPPLNKSPDVTGLQRIRTAFRFITASYLANDIDVEVQKRLANTDLIDFEPLNKRLAELDALKSEALTSRSISDFSRKRASAEDEDAAEARAEKKRKQDEEEKRKKAGESRGVRDLKKVNVTGMKKMSDFFAKKPTQVKSKT